MNPFAIFEKSVSTNEDRPSKEGKLYLESCLCLSCTNEENVGSSQFVCFIIIKIVDVIITCPRQVCTRL